MLSFDDAVKILGGDVYFGWCLHDYFGLKYFIGGDDAGFSFQNTMTETGHTDHTQITSTCSLNNYKVVEWNHHGINFYTVSVHTEIKHRAHRSHTCHTHNSLHELLHYGRCVGREFHHLYSSNWLKKKSMGEFHQIDCTHPHLKHFWHQQSFSLIVRQHVSSSWCPWHRKLVQRAWRVQTVMSWIQDGSGQLWWIQIYLFGHQLCLVPNDT